MTPDTAQRGRAGLGRAGPGRAATPLMEELQLLSCQHKPLFRCDIALKLRKMCFGHENTAGR